MPWKETDVLEERTRFVLDHDSEQYTMAELCRTTFQRSWIDPKSEERASFPVLTAVMLCIAVPSGSKTKTQHTKQLSWLKYDPTGM
jgi:hypothetical protein